jgi:hypothetical protein
MDSIGAVFFNGDILVTCIGSFLPLPEKAKLSQTCSYIRKLFLNKDRALRFMCKLWSIEEIVPSQKRKCVITCGILECVKFIESKEKEDPYNYLIHIYDLGQQNILLYFFNKLEHSMYTDDDDARKIFKKVVKHSVMNGFFEIACSLFLNKNALWMNHDYYNNVIVPENTNIQFYIWIRICMKLPFQIIIQLEPVFNIHNNLESLTSCLDGRAIWRENELTVSC